MIRNVTSKHLEVLARFSQIMVYGELILKSFPSEYADSIFDLVQEGYLEREARNFNRYDKTSKDNSIPYDGIYDFKDSLYQIDSKSFYGLTEKGRDFVGRILKYASGFTDDVD